MTKAAIGKGRCVMCNKEKSAVKCQGCSQLFCFDHLPVHREKLSLQLDNIVLDRDLFQEAFNEQIYNPQKHSLIKQIDKWKEESIIKIQRTANEFKRLILHHTTGHFKQIKTKLDRLTNQLREIRRENDFNEIEIKNFKQKIEQLTEELHKPSNVSVQEDTDASLINKISVIVSSKQSNFSSHINNNTKWKKYGITVAGGFGQGNELYQLDKPCGLYVDDDHHCIYIADYENHRIAEWKYDANNSQVSTLGNGNQNRIDQLNRPRDVIIDKRDNSIIISDRRNRRVVRRFRQNVKNAQIIISDIDCWGLAMDNNGDLYVSDCKKNEVRRWKRGDNYGTIVAGGNGKGDNLNQLNFPTFIFVDDDYSVYVSDSINNRVMKWMKGAKEGIVIIGEQDEQTNLTQLLDPQGLVVDPCGNVYVADSGNNRIICWSLESKQVRTIAGGNGEGPFSYQLSDLGGLSFDGEGNLYVVDCGNNRVQKFEIH